MNHALIGLIAGALSLLQVIPYLSSILKGRTKPERASYLIWTIVNILSIASYISVGATTTIWNGLVLSLTGFIIFLLSFKYGMGGFSKFDIVCLALALCGIALWSYSSNPEIALYFMTFIGVMGFLPTIKKTYFFPKDRKPSFVVTDTDCEHAKSIRAEITRVQTCPPINLRCGIARHGRNVNSIPQKTSCAFQKKSAQSPCIPKTSRICQVT